MQPSPQDSIQSFNYPSPDSTPPRQISIRDMNLPNNAFTLIIFFFIIFF